MVMAIEFKNLTRRRQPRGRFENRKKTCAGHVYNTALSLGLFAKDGTVSLKRSHSGLIFILHQT